MAITELYCKYDPPFTFHSSSAETSVGGRYFAETSVYAIFNGLMEVC